MKAIVFDTHGDESVLRLDDVEPPEMIPDGVRITVAAAGVNRADIVQRRGFYPPPPGASPILGLECAGTVTEVGPETARVRTGDRVMALLTGGGYAEEVVVSEGCVLAAPASFSDAEAGGFAEVFITAFLNLFLLGELEAGSTALVHGGSGGVGTAAIQLATMAGVRILVTAGSPERCSRCLELGADRAFDYHDGDFVQRTLDATGGDGVDVVLDCIGGKYLEPNLGVLATDGRLVIIGLMGGRSGELDLGRMLGRRLSVIGSTLRSRPAPDKERIIGCLMARFGPSVSDGSLRPVIHQVVPLAEASEAHRMMASGDIFGKVVLSP
jgi:putative PIG3 family NAD(P)H quinone oxidoreductase